MNINGTERWRGTQPNPVSMKQKVYFAIIKEMTGEVFDAKNSEEAYEFIGEYKSRIETDVEVEYFFDDMDQYVFYTDVYIFGRYRFTIKSRTREPIDYTETIDTAKIKSFEIYEDDSFI